MEITEITNADFVIGSDYKRHYIKPNIIKNIENYKNMTQEEKAKAYDDAKARMSRAWNDNRCTIGFMNEIFPELEETEDDKVKKFILEQLFKVRRTTVYKSNLDIELANAIKWLEKQGEKSKKVSIWKHWKNGIVGNGNGEQIYLIKIGNVYDVSSTLSCECDYIELSELDNLLLEKQGDTNETINNNKFAQGVLRGAAINLITWIDYNAAEGNMCLSNVQCNDIVNALVNGDWNKIYAYMKKKLEKQCKQKPAVDFKAKDWCVSKVDGKIHDITHSPNDKDEKSKWTNEDDEKTRKELIQFIKNWKDPNNIGRPHDFPTLTRNVEQCDRYITWLEKQGDKSQSKTALETIEEEKVDNANKVEPKFKVRDWVVDRSGLTQQVLDFRGGVYTCTYNSFTTDCESNYHLWTIKDAKDGDVLKADDMIVLFNRKTKNDSIVTYFNYDTIDNECELGTRLYYFNIYPAIKKQRDILFQKMHEVGYEWDAEKKELKKLNNKSNMEIFGRKLVLVEDDTSFCDKRCALFTSGICEVSIQWCACEDAKGNTNRHFESVKDDNDTQSSPLPF